MSCNTETAAQLRSMLIGQLAPFYAVAIPVGIVLTIIAVGLYRGRVTMPKLERGALVAGIMLVAVLLLYRIGYDRTMYANLMQMACKNGEASQ